MLTNENDVKKKKYRRGYSETCIENYLNIVLVLFNSIVIERIL